MPQFERVLVPLDFSELSDTVLRYGVELTRPGGTTILLHVLEPLPLHFESAFGTFVNTEGLMRIRENAEKLLEEAKAKYPDRTFVTELKEGKASSLVLDAAKRHGVNLIVMGTHGRGGLEHLFLGSVAARVVRRASCPVMTVREPDGNR
ncbi:MAG: universal stress protein [Planctomycetota bacterium]|jgi:nucleotide-binding universal stress UspA family protein